MNGSVLLCAAIVYFGLIYITRAVSEHRRNVR